jgi:hypothetical protein
MKQNILHYPRLDTVLMVEKAIREAEDAPTRKQLWLGLPRKVHYQTFRLIIEYLQEIGKIIIKDGRLVWVWDPEGVRHYLSRPELRVR